MKALQDDEELPGLEVKRRVMARFNQHSGASLLVGLPNESCTNLIAVEPVTASGRPGRPMQKENFLALK